MDLTPPGMAVDTEWKEGAMKATTKSAPRTRRSRRIVVGIFAAAAVALGAPTAAIAATSQTSTLTLTATPGVLSVGTPTPATITGVVVGSSKTGTMPKANWSDYTGSGSGWHGQIQVSDLSYTGAWSQISGTTTALGTTTSPAYTGTKDGVAYTVTVGTGGTAASTPVTWSSNLSTTANKSGSGTATNGTLFAVGTLGVKITFKSGTTYPTGAVYEIKVGTQPKNAISLDKTASGAAITPGTGVTNPPPAFYGSAMTGGGVGSYGTAITFLKATLNHGMGNYTVTPGVNVQTDPQTWAATYKANVQYTIATGP